MGNNEIVETLRPVSWGIVLAVFTILYGFGLGMYFGLAEDSIKAGFRNSAEAVKDDVYTADDGSFSQRKFDAALSGAWKFWHRAHFHANGIGTAALAMCLLLAFCVPVKPLYRMVTSILLGIGALGYSSFWMFAGMAAPGLGSTAKAHEALSLQARLSGVAGAIGVVLTLAIVVYSIFLSGRTKAGE